MDSPSSTKDLSSSHSSKSEQLKECIDAFGNVEPYAYEPFTSDSSSGESDDQEDTDAEKRLNNTDWLA